MVNNGIDSTIGKVMAKSDVYPGLLIMLAAAAALLMCNLGYQDLYHNIWAQYIELSLGPWAVKKQLLPLINEGLMAIFFLVVTIEIRHEFMFGVLNDRRYIWLPLIAAIGGMVFPAAIYLGLNWGTPLAVGWAIPTATDIAFSLACLMLVGKSLPAHLRVFLLSLAVIDDLGAILIIALYYSDNLSMMMLGGFALVSFAMAVLNMLRIRSQVWYLLCGVIAWLFLLKSGVHATLTGCVVALFLPMSDDQGARVKSMYKKLLPWVNYGILPLFAFANTGVVLAQDVNVLSPMFHGIMGGLVIGKPLGVLAFSYLAIRTGVAILPEGVRYRHIVGVGLLCGIGFTMSLFVGMLAFDEALSPLLGTVRMAVLTASLVAGASGMLFLKISCRGEGV
ncbi:Na+/H+ antiporter NhaA [Candidatus Synchoanobacter obligatus]|uniref:Na(+)/H(+) antiporter NhaA n=1 Tax=Candidatus Synchoanobacter obligatus TaxID=2919597 RepID=A0ABT1L621_9GAMM|nr:Na+/H+ antiporter NhaA [Candidatus Synchoanobacter obligatus]MCP8352627.1 Na+/H+ antiporter NhaA [Candidatus Synchoanobacter obligatus]